MKVELISYEYSPGVSLFVIPETAAERVLLQSLWKHGELSTCNGVADASEQGFRISTKGGGE